MSVEVSALRVYPVKSLRPMMPTSSIVETRGLKNDRRWMVTDSDGKFRTRRELPQMAQLNAVVSEDRLTLSKEGLPSIDLPLKPEGEPIPVQIWKSETTAKLVSPIADEWLTKAIGEPSRLVYMEESARRPVTADFNSGEDVLGFSDAFPILVASEASIEDLNGRMDKDIPIQRFRPNIILKGCGPFEEDTWSELRIGDVVLRGCRPSIRCLVTTQDPLTGESQGPEPLKTLATYRKIEGGVIFGMYFIPEELGTISVGDRCLTKTNS